MLRNAKDLIGSKIVATDGDVGNVHDFLFDDQSWTVRYMVADTGDWLRTRLVLLSPTCLGHADFDEGTFPVGITREQVEEAPFIDRDAPVSRQHEIAMAQHFAWPTYWSGGGILAAPATLTYPTAVPTASQPQARATEDAIARGENSGDPHLQSMRDVEGYSIHAGDGDIGHVSDFIVDENGWPVRYVEVDTRNWLPGKHVLVSPHWMTEVSWNEHQVMTRLTKDQIKGAPEYKHGTAIDRAYEQSLFEHYGQPAYWSAKEPAASRSAH